MYFNNMLERKSFNPESITYNTEKSIGLIENILKIAQEYFDGQKVYLKDALNSITPLLESVRYLNGRGCYFYLFDYKEIQGIRVVNSSHRSQELVFLEDEIYLMNFVGEDFGIKKITPIGKGVNKIEECGNTVLDEVKYCNIEVLLSDINSNTYGV